MRVSSLLVVVLAAGAMAQNGTVSLLHASQTKDRY
jgi:hypothetical protein